MDIVKKVLELEDETINDGRVGLKRGSQPPADTSPVYNEKTGHIFKKGNRFGTYYSKVPGTNQSGALTRTLEEVQALIDNAPKIEKKGKLVEMTPKDLAGVSEYNSVKENKGPAKVFISRKELKKYKGKLNFKTEGKPVLKENAKSEYNKKYTDFIKGSQRGYISLDRLTNFAHFAPKLKSFLSSTANTGPLKASVNRAAEGFDKAILKISQEQENLILEKPKNYKKLLLAKNKEAFETAKKFEKTLPNELKGTLGYFEVSPDGKFNLKGVDKSKTFAGVKGEEKFYKDMTSKERKDFGRAELEKIKNNPKFRAKIPLVNDLLEMAGSISDDIKRSKYLKAGFKTLGIAASPLVIYDTYKAFEQGKPILESLEQGLIGTDLIGGAKRVLSLTPEEREARSVVKQDALKDLNLEMPMGFGFIEGPAPDTDMTLEEAQAKAAAGDKRVKALEAQKNFKRATDRSNFFGNLKDKVFGAPQSLSFAGGGIAGLSGGDTEGAMLKSMNPDKDGLQGLLKRVKKG